MAELSSAHDGPAVAPATRPPRSAIVATQYQRLLASTDVSNIFAASSIIMQPFNTSTLASADLE